MPPDIHRAEARKPKVLDIRRRLPPSQPSQESDQFADAVISFWIALFAAAKWAAIFLVLIGIPTISIYSVRWAVSAPIHRQVGK